MIVTRLPGDVSTYQIREWVSGSVLTIIAQADSHGLPADADYRALGQMCLDLWGHDPARKWRNPPRWILEDAARRRRPADQRPATDRSAWPSCLVCQGAIDPAALLADKRPWHPTCRSCDCATPWDGSTRAGGAHCIECHHHFGGWDIYLAHGPYDDDGCTSLANLTDVDGDEMYALYREGQFKVWRRRPRAVGRDAAA